MKRWQVSGRTIFFLGMLLWLLGLATGWLAIPFGPRDGWQLSRDEVLCGILKDGPTMVTVPRPPSLPRTVGTPETGPIRLWNIETGELRAEHFTQTDVFDRVLPEESLGLIKVQEKVPDKPHTFRLRLLEALSGKQLAEFSCHVPRDNVWWLVSSDGKTTAFATFEGEKGRVEWWDIGTNQLIRSLEGISEPTRFSGDGTRFAGTSGMEIVVFDVPSGKELLRLQGSSNPDDSAYAKQFSPDNRLLLDSHSQVWEVETGKLRLRVPGIDSSSRSHFSPDGKYLIGVNTALIVVNRLSCTNWLAYYDLETGQELIARRVPLVTGIGHGMHLRPATDDGRLLMAHGTPRIEQPDQIFVQLGRIPGQSWFNRPKAFDAFVLIETATGREVMRGGTDAWRCTPDGKYLITRSRDEVFEIWDIPPRKPLRWFLPAAGAWSLFVTLLVGWNFCPRFRRPPTAAAASPSLPGT